MSGDPADAAARTTLAWTRTGLALAAAGALLIRLAGETPVPFLGWTIGGLDVLLAAGLWLDDDRRRRHGYGAPDPRTRVAVVAATVVTALCAIALSVLDVA
jgi:uncharacterized membrane protein YidH (DUF202 family)